MGPGRNRGWLLRLVIAFGFAQGAVSMARPAVSCRALALGADERAVGVIAGVYALLPLFALGQVAAPAAAGMVAGVAGVAAPFLMLGALLPLSAGGALRASAPPGRPPAAGSAPEGRREGTALRRSGDL
jgi:hypothetical protein